MYDNIKKVLLFSFMLLLVTAGCSGKDGTTGTDGLNGASIPVLSSVPFNNEKVLLTWSQPYGATGYTVYSSAVSGGPFSALGTTATTRYLVNDLTPGTTYYFVVTAQFSSVESPYSNVVSFRPYLEYNYTVGYQPGGIAIDAAGNIWVANYGDNTVSEIRSLTGTMVTTTAIGGLYRPAGIAIDASGNLWIANDGGNTVSEVTTSFTGYTYTIGASGSYPWGIAIDASGNVWVAPYNDTSIYEITSTTGTPVTSSIGGFNGPNNIALDASGNVWVTNYGNPVVPGTTVSEVTTSLTGYSYSVGSYPWGIAIDQSGNVWESDNRANTVHEITSTTGTPVTSTFIAGYEPEGIAIDAEGNVWIANNGDNTVSEITLTGTGHPVITTFVRGLKGPEGIAIDAYGNVWITNSNSNTVTELVGVTTGPQYFPYTGPQFPGGGNY